MDETARQELLRRSGITEGLPPAAALAQIETWAESVDAETLIHLFARLGAHVYAAPVESV